MNLFAQDDYRKILTSAFEEFKKLNLSFTLSKLSTDCGMQPSYLSNVMNGRGDFNSDQLFKIAEILNLPEDLTDFMLLLLEFEKSTVVSRRKKLNLQIEEIRRQKISVSKVLSSKVISLSEIEANEYYLDPYIELVHLYLGIDKKNSDLSSLAHKFGTNKAHMERIINTLLKLGFLKRKGPHWEVQSTTKHLPKESPLCLSHIISQRQLSLNQIQKLGLNEAYSFSAVIGSTESVRDQVKVEFLKFLRSLEKIVHDNPQEKLYQINFDLFPW